MTYYNFLNFPYIKSIYLDLNFHDLKSNNKELLNLYFFLQKSSCKVIILAFLTNHKKNSI